MMAWRHDESEVIGQQALALARELGAGDAEVRALTVIGADRAYLGRVEEGLDCLRRAVRLAEDTGDHLGLERAYVNLTDVLTMTGRPVESARVAETGLAVVRRFGMDSAVLVANQIEAWLATGSWDEADVASAAALRGVSGSFPYVSFMLRADLEVGRGDFDAARGNLAAALAMLREDRGQGIYDVYVAELALWERRWIDADRSARDALANAASLQADPLHVWFCAKGLRAQAELAALARARREPDAARAWTARRGRPPGDGASCGGPCRCGHAERPAWLLLAEAEHERARGVAQPQSWADAARAWDGVERPPAAAYCRWRQAEVLVGVGAGRVESEVPLREAYVVAERLRARPLLQELEGLARRARLHLTAPAQAAHDDDRRGTSLGLTTRELEVLDLVAHGYTNREIATALVISVRTASVHVSHILGKLGAPDRREAVAIAGRLSAPRQLPPRPLPPR